jgi:hypothetical protein
MERKPLSKAIVRALRRRIVKLVQQIAGIDD